MPLDFYLNKKFKSQNIQGNILLMLQRVLFFYASTKPANPELLVAVLGLTLSIKQTLQTFHFFFKMVATRTEKSVDLNL